MPSRLEDGFLVYAPAYWLIPKRRCYLRDSQIKPQVHKTSEMFYRFKTGEEGLAFPLALGMFQVLKEADALEFDCIIPIPLSPDKIANKELHRTWTLAKELSRLIGAPVVDALTLSEPISKRRGNWTSAHHFETRYCQVLNVSEKVRNYSRILLVDDACTKGSTLKCARRNIKAVHPNEALVVAATTAGQMIVTQVMTNESEVRAN